MDAERATSETRGGLRTIELRVVRPGAKRVAVAGEMDDWLAPRALEEREPGVFARRFALPEGAYAYKLVVDGAWELDGANPRTRASGVFRNNVLAVGAAEEPLLFAPAPPFAYEEDGGGVVITCGLRRGEGEAVEVLWTEDPRAGEQRTRMERVGEEAEHALFRARLPASAERVHVAFDLGGSGGGDRAPLGVGTRGRVLARAHGEAFVVERAAIAPGLPAWWRGAVVYAIFVDRFRPRVDRAGWERDPGADVAAGGHLDGVTRSLDAIADLGATALYLTPLHVAASCHRYDVVDPLVVDPALGGEEAFARLVEACRARGLRVIVDFAIGHAGRGFLPYEDVRLRGRASRFASWFQWADGEGDALRHYGQRTDAPLFDLDAPPVRAMARDAMAAWAGRGVDGVRLDAAAEVPMGLARELRAILRASRPEAIVLGEVVPSHAWRWRAAGAIDAATEFAFQRASSDLLARRATDARAACRAIAESELARGGPASPAVRFVSTHDHARFATLARASGHGANAPLGLVHLLTSSGVPMLLYGEELGLSARAPSAEPEGAWADRMPMRWDAGRDEATRALVRRLVEARHASPALSRGETQVLSSEEAVLVYRRRAEGDVVDVALNAGDERVEVEIADPEHPGLEVLVTTGEVAVRGAVVALGPGAAVVARRAHGGAPRSLRVLQPEHPRRLDAAFASRAVACCPPPTRIDLALTEACNLRCAHCITFAPQKTRAGRARTLAPWLLDRLRDGLSLARYVGFVHGGEPLVAPILWDALAALRKARGGFATDVHLLTNGMLLDARTTARLADAGVTSIAISIDGATAATNDRVRVGGDLATVLRHARDAVAARRALGLDLRLGISSVIWRQSLGEIEAIVELAADLGVDWVKLEEIVPVNPFAARAVVSPLDAEVRERVARAIAIGRERGVVVVDHTAPPAVWRCRLDVDPAARAFLAADEHANRSVIHPCRSPWERACVEPDGGVRVGDFYGPRVGTVAEAPLAALWNAPLAQRERARHEMLRPCGANRPTCV
jgi:glycosidase/MoaA/NifB/PqqE/SkfB family radical SAM enzyme